jgi:hypothetical protein
VLLILLVAKFAKTSHHVTPENMATMTFLATAVRVLEKPQQLVGY